MQWSSESIASLAAALAKAQAELVNPEKSLVGTIEGDGSGGVRRSFRYAPLSSGLDIVRKTLGQHEIATVQTTAIDNEASAVLCRQLLAEAADISSSEEATTWAQRALGPKNRQTVLDAASVEQAFEGRLATLASREGEAKPPQAKAERFQGPEPPARRRARRPRRQAATAVNGTIDKSALAIPEPRRVRDRDHVRSVAKQPCLICGRQPSDAHHVRFAQSPALGRRVSDEFTVPLCRGHHREVHRFGDEARALWLKTHPLPAPARA